HNEKRPRTTAEIKKPQNRTADIEKSPYAGRYAPASAGTPRHENPNIERAQFRGQVLPERQALGGLKG
ncbi:hypothetical protein, partial [Escherichia coli]|uniref:hypothetical protein n=1 Tax=Escherichia coli TaxID=562 RepID=UPI001BE3D32A